MGWGQTECGLVPEEGNLASLQWTSNKKLMACLKRRGTGQRPPRGDGQERAEMRMMGSTHRQRAIGTEGLLRHPAPVTLAGTGERACEWHRRLIRAPHRPPRDAPPGLPAPSPRQPQRASPLTQVLGGRGGRKSRRAGLAPPTGQASLPCLRQSRPRAQGRKWGHGTQPQGLANSWHGPDPWPCEEIQARSGSGMQNIVPAWQRATKGGKSWHLSRCHGMGQGWHLGWPLERALAQVQGSAPDPKS